ncbi:Pre-mRNA cleavage complex II protein Clp1-domain-containing protein [Gautieria morchelliformis]|nr:Pre-mRNA cleavage complex II protein Clp1-domain-containing protein [Gautieria morchelliformis]
MDPSAQIPEDVKEWRLESGTEYRFELDPDTSLAVKLVSGLAEVFGTELAVGKTFLFGSECKAAIFTWQGCTLEVIGRPSTEYVSEETPMVTYANLHLAFEQMRVRARRTQRGSPTSSGTVEGENHPPRVLVIGPENSGKTTCCKIIANYAVRAGQGWSPILVNLDPGEGGWTVPGTISACPVNMPIPTSSPENPLGSSATSAPTALTSSALLPLVYWFGHVEARRNPKLMDRLIQTLAKQVNARLQNDPAGSVSGLIIDTPASFAAQLNGKSGSGEKYAFIKTCVDLFKINVIVVIGHEKLNVEMRREFGDSLAVVKIPKSGGVVELDYAYRARVHGLQLHSYLYGQSLPLPPGVSSATLGGEALEELSLSPHSLVIEFSDLTIYRIGEEAMAPTSALPIGASRVVSEMQPVVVDPAQSGSGLMNAVLALLTQGEDGLLDDTAVLDRDVAGFLIVMSIDASARQMTILSPGPGSLQGRVALIGSLEWQEQ